VREDLVLRVACSVALVAGLVAAIRWTAARPATAPKQVVGLVPVAISYRGPSSAEIDDTAGVIGDRDPFRLTREPSSVPYVAGHEGWVAPPPAPRPIVTLSGIVGPPWEAVLEGVPGRAGSLVAAAGDTVSRAPLGLLVVRRVGRDTVVLVGTDTIWKLVVRP
jgi:hypothetical protein